MVHLQQIYNRCQCLLIKNKSNTAASSQAVLVFNPELILSAFTSHHSLVSLYMLILDGRPTLYYEFRWTRTYNFQ